MYGKLRIEWSLNEHNTRTTATVLINLLLTGTTSVGDAANFSHTTLSDSFAAPDQMITSDLVIRSYEKIEILAHREKVQKR